MNLRPKLLQRLETDGPVRVGMIGCGKFATMFAAQAPHMPGVELVAIADLMPERARHNLKSAGWDEAALSAVLISNDADAVLGFDGIDVIIEATGDPVAGTRHALAAINAGRHVVMVNVEADVLCGPALAARARDQGVVYSMAYGDQPSMIVELVDWARTCGFGVVAAGKGTRYQPHYHYSTPDTVWGHYGITAEHAALSGMNPKMFNSFLDGTKSAIEMAAVANATGLTVPSDGLAFPPCGVDDLQHVLRPVEVGGQLPASGMVEVVSSLERDGRPVYRDLRWGVYVVIEAPTAYAARSFADYGMNVDSTGRFASMYRPYHMIGLELGISVANAAVRGEASGCSEQWRGDVVAACKGDLQAGTKLDGEGGASVYGRLVPAHHSHAQGLLPMGLTHGARLKRHVARDSVIQLEDVEVDSANDAWRLRETLLPAT